MNINNINTLENFCPNDLEEAVDILITFFGINSEEAVNNFKYLFKDENKLIAHIHHTVGQFIRNSWFLWWYKDHNYKEWPKEKPKLVEYFNKLGIFHADDMSSIILTCLYRKINNLDWKLNEQIEFYIEYWKEKSLKK